MDIFEMAQKQVDEVAGYLRLDAPTHAKLREPMRELHVSIPIKRDDGSVLVLRGYRVQYNDALGPTKGGIRFHPEETINTVRALAAWMTWKTSIMGLPYGGGKGGVICNPKEMSERELEQVARGYIRALGRFIGPEKDIPAPDVYTNPKIMAWMMDEYSKIVGFNAPGVITGKPHIIGGSLGREDATARGGMFILSEIARALELPLIENRTNFYRSPDELAELPDPKPAGKKVLTAAIQGYGNAGYYAHLLLTRLFKNVRVVAVSDTQGGIYSSKGLPFKPVFEAKTAKKTVVKYPDAEKKITNEQLLELDVDILLPSAIENVITEENAEKIKAKVIIELANGPTTPEADHILHKNKKFVAPDFLANAGGVTVSYFEWVQNITGYYWEYEEVYEKLEKRMRKAFQTTFKVYKSEKVHPRLAAYIVAVKRVVEAMKARGWV